MEAATERLARFGRGEHKMSAWGLVLKKEEVSPPTWRWVGAGRCLSMSDDDHQGPMWQQANRKPRLERGRSLQFFCFRPRTLCITPFSPRPRHAAVLWSPVS